MSKADFCAPCDICTARGIIYFFLWPEPSDIKGNLIDQVTVAVNPAQIAQFLPCMSPGIYQILNRIFELLLSLY